MKINQIRARNVLGARDIDAVLHKPVTLFCGFNGAGKSSMQEALRLAMQGETLRVTHKKDFNLMVTDGAKDGFVKVVADDLIYEYRLPTGDRTVPESTVSADQLNSVLNAQRFASMSADDRRAFLTVLTNSKPNAKKITELLLEAGLDQERIDMAIPMLRAGTGGFPAACEIAKQKATEHKGAWKAVTGGAWGSIKGESWEAPDATAPAPEAIAEAADLVQTTEAALSELQQQLGAANEKIEAQKRRTTEITNATAKAGMLQRHKDKLVRDQEALTSYETALSDLEARAGTAPKVGLIHDMARFLFGISWGDDDCAVEAKGMIDRYESEFGPIVGDGDAEALAKIPAIKKSRDLMLTSVANDKRDIAAAEAAEAQLATLGALETVADDLVATVKEGITALSKELQAARVALKALQDQEKAAAERDQKTADAKVHHNHVVGWLKVAEQFAPDGIPSQILAKALEPINKLLREAAIATDWRQVTIAPDMQITADGRLYSLHSESERWMIDTQIAAVISQLSGLKMIVLDRFDVLDIRHRPELLYWLSDLAKAGTIESALVFGTLKEKPKGMPENIGVFWIDSGELEQAPAQDAEYSPALAA